MRLHTSNARLSNIGRRTNALWASAALIALCAALPVGQARAGCQLSYASEMPITVNADKTFTVPVKIHHKTVQMIFDTGSELSLLNRATADTLNLDDATANGSHLSQNEIYNNGKFEHVTDKTADITELGGFAGHGEEFMVVPKSNNVIGVNIFAPFDIDIDLNGKRLILYVGEGSCHTPTTNIGGELYIAPMYDQGAQDVTGVARYQELHRVLIPMVVQGKTFNALLDTASSQTYIRRAAALALNATNLPPAPPVSSTDFDLPPNPPVHNFTNVSIGEVNIASLPMALLETERSSGDNWDIVLGMDVMSKMHVWISQSSHSIIMQIPALPSPPRPVS